MFILEFPGTWEWVDGSSFPIPWEMWNPGEPNNYDQEDCAIVDVKGTTPYRWNDVPCSMKTSTSKHFMVDFAFFGVLRDHMIFRMDL